MNTPNYGGASGEGGGGGAGRQQYISPHGLINSNSLETVHSEHSAEPRPQSVLSLHSCLSQPDVPDTTSDNTLTELLQSPLPDDQQSLASTAQLEPIDEDYISASGGEGDDGDDDDDNETTHGDDDGGEDEQAEELKLQTKIADLRTRKEEMLNLVRELQTMNELSNAASVARQIPIQFERIVPIELVAASRGNSSAGPATTNSSSPTVVAAAASSDLDKTSASACNAHNEQPSLKPLASAKDDTLNRKLTEISSLKRKLTRLQDMMNTVNSLEKNSDAAAETTPTESVSPPPAAVDSAEEELEQRVKSIASMTQDLRLQSATLAAERDRLRDIKNELARRSELKETVLLDLEEHVGKQQQQQQPQQPPAYRNSAAKPPIFGGAERRPSAASLAAFYDEDSADGADLSADRNPAASATRMRFNDLSGAARDVVQPSGGNSHFKKSQSEEPWRRSDTALGAASSVSGLHAKRYGTYEARLKSNAYASASALNNNNHNSGIHNTTDRYGLDFGGGVADDLVSADDGSVLSEGSKCGSGMPPAMRQLEPLDTHGWRKSVVHNLAPSGSSLEGCATGGAGSDVTCRQTMPLSACCHRAGAGSPQCAGGAVGGGGGAGGAATAAGHHYSFNDPMLLQQFIQTQQMLINSVSQCNQLLWDQQRDINQLNGAVILLQERILNFANARTESVASQSVASQPIVAAVNRAESVPPPQHPATAYQAYQPTQRAQSEHPISATATQSLHAHHHHQQLDIQSHSQWNGQSQQQQHTSYPSYAAQAQAALSQQSHYPHQYWQSTPQQQQQQQQQHAANSRPPLPPQHQHHHNHQAHQHQLQQQHHHHQPNPHTHSLPYTNASLASLPSAAPPSSGQFPLPPPHEFRRSDRSSIGPNELSHPPTAAVVPSAYLNNNPNSPLFNGLQQQQQPQQPHLAGPPSSSSAAAMFVYRNIHQSAAGNGGGGATAATNNLGGGGNNSNSNHTIAANLNTSTYNAYGMQQQQQQQPQQQPHQSQQQQQPITLNNQVPPGNRANNYWDNFRSYSRQNLLSTTNTMPCKSNENVCVSGLQPVDLSTNTATATAVNPQQLGADHQLLQPPQSQSLPPPPLAPAYAPCSAVRTDNAAAAASIQQQQQQQQLHRRTPPAVSHLQQQQQQHHISHNILPVMDNKYFMHFRNQIHHHDQQQQQQQQHQREQQQHAAVAAHQQQQQQLEAEIDYYFGDLNRAPAAASGASGASANLLLQQPLSEAVVHSTIAMLIQQHNKNQSRRRPGRQSSANRHRHNDVQRPAANATQCNEPAAAAAMANNVAGAATLLAAAPLSPRHRDANLMNSRAVFDKPSGKSRHHDDAALTNEICEAIGQIIAANEQRPGCLQNLLFDIQYAPKNDALLPIAADNCASAPDNSGADNNSARHEAVVVVVDDDIHGTCVNAMLEEINNMLRDCDPQLSDHQIRERCATIVLRELERQQPPGTGVSREELMCYMPPLDRAHPVKFLMLMLSYLNAAVAYALAPMEQPPQVPRDCSATSKSNRRKRTKPQRNGALQQNVAEDVAVAVAPTFAAAAAAAAAASAPVSVLPSAVAPSNNDNEDLAEADQMCSGGGGGAAGRDDDPATAEYREERHEESTEATGAEEMHATLEQQHDVEEAAARSDDDGFDHFLRTE